MIGSGDGFDDAVRIAAELNLSRDVTFAGQLGPARYGPLLAGADAGVSPYCGWPEFSGLKVLDYKAAGLPTIASGMNGHPPTLTAGVTGLIVPPCQVEALCEAIGQICSDRTLRRTMGRAARFEAETGHTWARTVERLEQVFLDVLARRTR
jgi:glycosyltransferase involved in cell wall biosynthesis